MKKVGVFIAFLVAASSAALAATSPDPSASNSPSKETTLLVITTWIGIVEGGRRRIGIEKGHG
ncbi:hypothetical protein C4D60_Mb05t03070 [Musa balbisiana]|uniref:Uncharacterized protein n=1 Tax=Musa balbisiana TaxID=52838 RepID=A0A4S8JTA5_MUSBA|nr:hypothetical protein C4D60_Mb05t03070 [Musa balbisiana]